MVATHRLQCVRGVWAIPCCGPKRVISPRAVVATKYPPPQQALVNPLTALIYLGPKFGTNSSSDPSEYRVLAKTREELGNKPCAMAVYLLRPGVL